MAKIVKRISMVLCAVILLLSATAFSSCRMSNIKEKISDVRSKLSYDSVSSKSDQDDSPVSYGPNAPDSEKTEEKTLEHERRLKIIDENGGVREGVNFVGTYARLDGEGNLVVDGYMRNFTDHEIYNITGNITVENATQDYVAAAYFELPEISWKP